MSSEHDQYCPARTTRTIELFQLPFKTPSALAAGVEVLWQKTQNLIVYQGYSYQMHAKDCDALIELDWMGEPIAASTPLPPNNAVTETKTASFDNLSSNNANDIKNVKGAGKDGNSGDANNTNDANDASDANSAYDASDANSAYDTNDVGDANGVSNANNANKPEAIDCANLPLAEQVWIKLRTCYDPEIPVNIVELGLIYQVIVSEIDNIDNPANDRHSHIQNQDSDSKKYNNQNGDPLNNLPNNQSSHLIDGRLNRQFCVQNSNANSDRDNTKNKDRSDDPGDIQHITQHSIQQAAQHSIQHNTQQGVQHGIQHNTQQGVQRSMQDHTHNADQADLKRQRRCDQHNGSQSPRRHNVKIIMTLTNPACSMSDIIIQEMQEKISALQGVANVAIELVFDPPWSYDCLSEQAKLELGLL